MISWLLRRWRANKFLFLSRPCETCGGSGATLVIDAHPAGKRIDGKTGLVVKTYDVKRADWVCRGCRVKT